MQQMFTSSSHVLEGAGFLQTLVCEFARTVLIAKRGFDTEENAGY